MIMKGESNTLGRLSDFGTVKVPILPGRSKSRIDERPEVDTALVQVCFVLTANPGGEVLSDVGATVVLPCERESWLLKAK